MRRIYFSSVKALFEFLTTNLESWETLTHRESELDALLRILTEILGRPPSPGPWDCVDTGAALHYSALAVQTLSLAFLSYSQGHTGSLQPFFLDAPVQRIALCGTGPHLADRYGALEAQFKDLSCVGNMLGGPVLCFAQIQLGTLYQDRHPDLSVRHDLFANTEDMVDTWGPGNPVLASAGPDILAVHLGGGIISADTRAKDGTLLFHWSPYGPTVGQSSELKPFRPGLRIRIATAVTENPQCVRDEDEWWTRCSSCATFQDLGTHDAYWRQTERQLIGQGGNYVTVSAGFVWNKVQAYTLKQRKLKSADNELVPFLEDPFGVQVSLCTGVSRRVTVRKMLANLMPVFAKASIKPEEIAAWKALHDDHHILEIFKGDTGHVKNWLVALPDTSLREYVMMLIRDILRILKHTGFNADTKLLNIAWPHESDLRKCFQIPSQGKDAWLRFFADSSDCVTFAYITTKCLETGNIKCRGSTTPWANAITVLETAVLRLIILATDASEQQLETRTQNGLLLQKVRAPVLCSGRAAAPSRTNEAGIVSYHQSGEGADKSMGKVTYPKQAAADMSSGKTGDGSPVGGASVGWHTELKRHGFKLIYEVASQA